MTRDMLPKGISLTTTARTYSPPSVSEKRQTRGERGVQNARRGREKNWDSNPRSEVAEALALLQARREGRIREVVQIEPDRPGGGSPRLGGPMGAGQIRERRA